MARKEVVKAGVSQNYLLLVEGKNDQHVIWSLLEHYGVPETFEVRPVDGIDKLSDAFEDIFARFLDIIEVELTRIVEGKVGIVIDADIDLAARWQATRDILIRSGYNSIPQMPIPEGTVIQQSGRPVVGIWVMPDNQIPGMLEDFVSLLRPQGDLLWPFAEEAIQKVKTIEEKYRFRDKYESKARIHTWLAWQKEPGKPMGQAITARYLDPDSPHAQELIAWIRRLFEL